MIKFSKMHGLGNDFVVIDAINQDITLSTEQIRFIADRHIGIGCDQLLLVEAPQSEAADFRYRIFNADGGEVGQCGNGARCFARYVREHNLSKKSQILVEVAGGIIQLMMESNGQVTVDMGRPQFMPAEIPFIADAEAPRYIIDIDDAVYEIGAVSMGNPHAVLQVASVDDARVARLGAQIEAHAKFPERVNVGFMEVVDPRHIRLRVFERGAGETQACGTGACAAVAIGRRWSVLEDEVLVDLPGGSLWVRWAGDESSVRMTGPATHVYEGTIEL
ncbi:MAG: diaminopimelate epimerase [Thiotrichaceae bacterium]|nr:diaminopimelate epimerase [Thiotrichaceae bacterium]